MQLKNFARDFEQHLIKEMRFALHFESPFSLKSYFMLEKFFS